MQATYDKAQLLFANFEGTSFQYPQLDNQQEIMDDMVDMYRLAIHDTLFVEREYAGGSFGVSQLGRPQVVTAWEYFYPETKTQFATPIERQLKYLRGHQFETEVYYFLRRLGFTDIDWQSNVKVHELIPSGHPDFVVRGEDGETFIVECKFINKNDFNAYQRSGKMENKRYVNQLHMYCEALNCRGMWVIGCTDTGRIQCIEYTQRHREYNKALSARALATVAVISQAATFADCLKAIKPPRPLSTKAGRLYLPPELYVSKGVLHPVCCLYQWHLDDDNKVTVTGYNYPEEVKEFEPQL